MAPPKKMEPGQRKLSWPVLSKTSQPVAAQDSENDLDLLPGPPTKRLRMSDEAQSSNGKENSRAGDVSEDAGRYPLGEENSCTDLLSVRNEQTLLADHLASIEMALAGIQAAKSLKDLDAVRQQLSLRKGHLETLLAPKLSPPLLPSANLVYPKLVDTAEYVVSVVWPLVDKLHRLQPEHPMFGPCTMDRIRAPFRLPGGKGAATSWHMKVQKLGANVKKSMGERIPEGSCWIVRGDSTSIAEKPSGGEQKKLVEYKTARWLAFLVDPTPANWAIFSAKIESGEKSQAKSYFLHFCHNGHASAAKNKGPGCVNGVQHGRFGSAAENNAQRKCSAGDRSRCPGHPGGDPAVHPQHCLYVHHSSGWPKPCFDSLLSSSKAACRHHPNCYEK
ncbi:MAG: hypothetical protein Q9209_007969 [Squamulea sp. 1 TL-2023]